MKNFMPVISLLTLLQASPSQGAHEYAVGVSSGKDIQDVTRVDEGPKIRIDSPPASPSTIRSLNRPSTLGKKKIRPLPLPKIMFNMESTGQYERGPLSPRNNFDSASRPETPHTSPREHDCLEQGGRHSASSGSLFDRNFQPSKLDRLDSHSRQASSSSLSGSGLSLSSSCDSIYDDLKCPKDLKHLVVAADGHRREEEKSGVPLTCMYAKSAYRTLPKFTKHALKSGVETVTIWFFTPQNLKRPREQVECMFHNSYGLIEVLIPLAHKLEAKIRHLGRKEHLPPYLLKILEEAERVTSHYSAHELNFAIDYGGQQEIVDALRKIVKIALDTPAFDINDISEMMIDEHLQLSCLKNPKCDLFIRTSGERLTSESIVPQIKSSGLMAWNSHHYMIYLARVPGPELRIEHLAEAFEVFAQRPLTKGI